MKLLYTRDDNGTRCLWSVDLESKIEKTNWGQWELPGEFVPDHEPFVEEYGIQGSANTRALKELTRGLGLRKGRKCIIELKAEVIK